MTRDAKLSKLVRAAKTGKSKYITELYNQTKDYAYYVAGHYVAVCDISDVLQEAYISVFQNLQTFDETRDFKPWLQTIVRNKCIDFLKRMGSRPFAYNDAVEYLTDDSSLPIDLLEKEQARQDIQKIIDNLSIGQRTTVTLFYLEGVPIAEIAQILNITDGTVKKQLYLARKAIREAVLLEEIENDNKLYGVAAVPFLTQLFEKQLERSEYTMPAQMSDQVLGAVVQGITANGVVHGFGSLSWIMGGKLIAIIATVTCVAVGGSAIYFEQQPHSPVAHLPEATCSQASAQQEVSAAKPISSEPLTEPSGQSSTAPTRNATTPAFIKTYDEWHKRYSTEKVRHGDQWLTQEEIDQLSSENDQITYDPEHQAEKYFFTHIFATLEQAVEAYPSAFEYVYCDGYLRSNTNMETLTPDPMTNGWPYYLAKEGDENNMVFGSKEEAVTFIDSTTAKGENKEYMLILFQNEHNQKWNVKREHISG